MKAKVKVFLRVVKKVFYTLKSLLYVFLFSRRASFNNKAGQGKSVLVLGNGPSLKKDIDYIFELNKKSCADVCAVNDFAFSEVFFKIRPCVYVLADPNYWNESVRDDVRIKRLRLMDILANEVAWPMRVMVPIEAKKNSVFDLEISKFVTFEYYNRTPINGFENLSFRLFDAGVGMPPPFNVLIAALTLSIASGYKKIYIFGADHSWHEELALLDGKNILVSQKHFYDDDAVLKPVYKNEDEVFTVGELFIRWGKVFRIYEILALYAEYKCVDILNLSSKTYIDAFPRAKVSELKKL